FALGPGPRLKFAPAPGLPPMRAAPICAPPDMRAPPPPPGPCRPCAKLATGAAASNANVAAPTRRLEQVIVLSIYVARSTTRAVRRSRPGVTKIREQRLIGAGCTDNERQRNTVLPYWTILRANGIRSPRNRASAGLMKQFFLKIFTWWNSQTFGT